MDSDVKHSPLEPAHLKLGARMVPFAGWLMPIQYDGILAEHRAVREKLGIFDISHMGQITIRGDGNRTTDWLNSLLTNDVSKLGIGEGQYTLMLNEQGGVIDDLIVYRTREDEFFLVVNASRTAEDHEWLYDHLDRSTRIELVDESRGFAGMAIQGPDSVSAFKDMVAGTFELPERFGITKIETTEGNEIVVCRTGYTGEDGFELFCSTETAVAWWERAVEAGAKPCGLGARDSLRLEKCYPLNGNDLSPNHTPIEAGLGFFVDFDKGDFLGRDVLARQKADGPERRLVAIKAMAKGPPPRPGYGIQADGESIGTLSSGTLSPSLGTGIGMGYVPPNHAKVGTQLELEVRGKCFEAEVVKKPFV
ncbi:MAG: glycine cleavage system aminomethyltransferase GcvT [Verrucomicrobiota bacterium]